MGTVNPQKIKLLKLYEILRQHTDEDRPLSTNQLCAMLETEGITCDRRTLAEDIDILNANGFEVLRRRTRYAMLFYIVDRRFDLAEVKILIDAIQAASFITKQKTKELTDKVASLAGSHMAAALTGNLVTFNTRKHTNEAIYYTLEIIACKRGLCKATVEVLVSPVFFGWCFQFGKSMKILSPESIALEMKEQARAVAKMYRK